MMRTLIFLIALVATPAAASAQSLVGVWKGTEIEVLNGPDAGVTAYENPRYLIYTNTHFMWAFEENGERPTGDSDAEVSQAAQMYQSVAGTYIRDGATIMYNRVIALNPNGMLPESQPLTRQIRLLTPNALETQLTNAEGVTSVLRYVRVE
jgi:hypothetical protein